MVGSSDNENDHRFVFSHFYVPFLFGAISVGKLKEHSPIVADTPFHLIVFRCPGDLCVENLREIPFTSNATSDFPFPLPIGHTSS